MMSELSARLLAGSGISFASSGYAGDVDDQGQARRSPTSAATTSAVKQPSAPRRPTTTSGIQAPAGTSARPPSFIQMTDGGGRQLHHGDDDAHHQKRRKLHHQHHHHHARNAESTYAASTVLKDLSKGGLSHKRLIGTTEIVRSSSLLPPNSRINMTRVNILTSKDYDMQLEAAESARTNDKTYSGFKPEVYGGGPDSDIFALLRDCSSFYRTLLTPQLTTAAVDDHNHTARSESGVSSVDRMQSQSPLQQEGNASSKHSKDGVSNSDEGLKGEAISSLKECNLDGCSQSSRSSSTSSARSETGSCTSSMTDNSDDGSNANNEDGPDGASSNRDASDTSPSPSGTYIRMGDALSSSNLPRLIALSFKPFVVVHVNGPFTELTGQNSIGVLGKPLHDMFVQDPLVTAALQTSCQQFTLDSLDGQAIKMIPSHSSTGSLSDVSRSTGASGSVHSSSSHGRKRGRQSSSSLCTVRVRPIGQDGASGHITHYLLEIVQVGDKDLLEDSDAACGDNAVIRGQLSESESLHSSPMQVMA